MRLKRLQQFICDNCGHVIEDPKHGWVEWLIDPDQNHAVSDFYIVHHAMYSPLKPDNCFHHQGAPRRHDTYLTRFVGEGRMAMLLRFLDVGPYHEPEHSGPRVADMRKYVEFMRRLALPYYEEARLYWERAERDGYFVGGNEIWIYQPDTLRALIERYGDS